MTALICWALNTNWRTNVLQVPCPDTYRGMYTDKDYPGEDLSAKYASEVDNIIEGIEKNGKGVCCFIAESMQSCGGQIIYPEGYLQRVYEYVLWNLRERKWEIFMCAGV